ncbi:MAG: SURF1 family protein [Alphaproteobacteria bacterium]|nr:SURF1 family protein [Alphaproteobacteria bacterium]
MVIKFHKKIKIRLMLTLMLATLIALGVWQMQRLAWKTELLSRIDAQMQQPPEALPAEIAVPADWEYRNVDMAGDFDPKTVFWIKPRTENGKVGAHMLAGFRRTDSDLPVFVNLGFVPDHLMDKAAVPEAMQEVRGVVQIPYPSAFTPDNDPVRGDWYWADIPALAKAAGYAAVTPVIVTVPPHGQGYPAGFAVTANIRNNHLQYALFWFSMAAILLIVFTLSQREKPANPAKTE